MRGICAITSCLIMLCGYHGPLGIPMVERLSDDEQKQIDEGWGNMFTPAERLDRELLLDTLITYQLHHRGVDSLRLVSEKRIGENLVVMEIRFDLDDPEHDEFEISYVDSEGYELRRERFSHGEVLGLVNYLFCTSVFLPDKDEPPSDEELQRQAKHEARMEAIRTATQPTVEE